MHPEPEAAHDLPEGGLDEASRARYDRQLRLAHLGEAGQARLLGASVFVLGAGGLGSAVLPYLVGAGVGRITIADGDHVEVGNLHRQVLYRTGHAGRNKAREAVASLGDLNPEVVLRALDQRLDEASLAGPVASADLVLDCSDNFATRYALADICRTARRPLVTAAVVSWEGWLMTILPEGPCLRCLMPTPPPAETVRTAREIGVLGPVVGVLGTLQATEAIKVLLGMDDLLDRKLLRYDATRARFHTLTRSAPCSH